MPPNPQGQPAAPIPGVKNLIAVASGKGGVGKTTVAVNLAIALQRMGSTVGLLDGDVYGPNVPRMLGTSEQPQAISERAIMPITAYGLKMISVGLLNPGDRPLIWRGPMLHSLITQFLRSVQWGELDYLVIDLPPGTGDVQLTLIQTVPLTGALLITTPSAVALDDVRKAIEMFRQVNVEVLGVVENMSFFACPHCKGEIPASLSRRWAKTLPAQRASTRWPGRWRRAWRRSTSRRRPPWSRSCNQSPSKQRGRRRPGMSALAFHPPCGSAPPSSSSCSP